MKAYIKQLFSLAALTSMLFAHVADASQCGVTTAFHPRSQSRDWARQMVGVTQYIHQPDSDLHGFFSVAPVYTQSFRPKDIAHCLLGTQDNCNNDCPTILVQGSQVADRNAQAWLADNFYLPVDFSGSFSIKPRIRNFLVDLDFYMGLDNCLCGGTWLWIYGPITYTNWDLNYNECEPVVTGTQAYPAGYFSPNEIARANLLPNFSAYINGCNHPNAIVDENVGTISFQPLHFTRMDCRSHSKVGFADLRVNLGWDFFQNDCGHLGIYGTVAFPTGNRRDSCLLFDPIVGNDKHWELGAGLTAHHLLWDNECYDYQLSFYFNANVTHLFGSRQQRTFDLCNRPNSRYLLAQRLDGPILNSLVAGPNPASNAANNVTPIAQFKGEYAPVANLTTMDVRVSVPAEAEIVALFNIQWCNSSFDIGYNFWGRACEKIDCAKPRRNCTDVASVCDAENAQQWAIKGDSRVFGFLPTSTTPVALSATQSGATICSALNTNAVDTNNDALFNRNAAVDNRAFAFSGANALLFDQNLASADANQLYTSLNPEFIKCNDINLQATRGISHKIFAHYSYNWLLCDCYNTFIGLGGFGEFGKNSKNNCPTTTSTVACATSCGPCSYVNDPCKANCIDCSLSQWAVWLKGGVAF